MDEIELPFVSPAKRAEVTGTEEAQTEPQTPSGGQPAVVKESIHSLQDREDGYAGDEDWKALLERAGVEEPSLEERPESGDPEEEAREDVPFQRVGPYLQFKLGACCLGGWFIAIEFLFLQGRVFPHRFSVGLAIVYVIIGLLVWFQRRRGSVPVAFLHLSLVADLAAMGLVLRANGGLQSNWCFLPVFIILAAVYLMEARAGYIYAGLSFTVVGVLFSVEHISGVQHFVLGGGYRGPFFSWSERVISLFLLYFGSACGFSFLIGQRRRLLERMRQSEVVRKLAVLRFRRAEADTAEKQERLNLVFESIGNSILWVDLETDNIVNCNEEALRLLRKERREVIGCFLGSVFPPMKSEYYIGQFRKLMRKQGRFNTEMEVITKLGRMRQVDVTATIGTYHGKPVAQCVMHDITERKQAEMQLRDRMVELEEAASVSQHAVEKLTNFRNASIHILDDLVKTSRELAEAKDELERSNTELQQFAYIASHDLQEPLRKVETFGDRLRSKYGDKLDEQALDYLSRMQGAATRMRKFIIGLLEFSRVTTDAHPFESVDLNKVVTEVRSDLEIRIEQTGGVLEVGELPCAEADPLQMRQLFQNLVGNALKFHRDAVTPIIKVYSKVQSNHDNLLPTLGSDAMICEIFVEDNGIGFDEKFTDRIFNLFQRLHGRTEYEGAGVGLATCRKIVERHGGEIVAQSQPGHGATFMIRIPTQQNR